MQGIAKESPISIQEIAPATFASLCTEAHAVNRGKLADCLDEMVEHDRGALFTAHDPAGTRVGRVCVEINPMYVTLLYRRTYGFFTTIIVYSASDFNNSRLNTTEVVNWWLTCLLNLSD